MKRITRKSNMGGLLALLVLGIFATSILSVLLTGADAYRRLTERDSAAYDLRTAAQYLATRVRQGDVRDGVTVEPFGDTLALTLAEDIDGERYLTRVYYYDGYLRELFSAQEDALAPEDGEKILEAQGLTLGLEDGVLSLSVTDGGGQQVTQTLTLRGGRGAAS